MPWQDEQEWEKDWWGNCTNTYGEESKQFVYANRMGLKIFSDGKSPYNFNAAGYILDIGGGPVSMLLKCPHATGLVIDPCSYPDWVYKRYDIGGIKYKIAGGEDISYENEFDEVWIYNCLQHVQDPEKIVYNALKATKTIVRVFEWLEVGISKGHPHNLTQKSLDEWFKGIGKTEHMNESGCTGFGYYGIFKGLNYDK